MEDFVHRCFYCGVEFGRSEKPNLVCPDCRKDHPVVDLSSLFEGQELNSGDN